MKFFDKISLNTKLSTISRRRNEKTWQLSQSAALHSSWVFIAPYLGLIFQSIADDPKCNDVFSVLVKADENSLNQVSKLLVFWFYWSMARLVGYNDWLQDTKTKVCFEKIWYLDNNEFQKLINLFDGAKSEERVLILWKLICDELGVTGLMPIFALKHIRNAQVTVIEPGNLEKMHGL